MISCSNPEIFAIKLRRCPKSRQNCEDPLASIDLRRSSDPSAGEGDTTPIPFPSTPSASRSRRLSCQPPTQIPGYAYVAADAGVVDDATVRQMKAPRCGLPDSRRRIRVHRRKRIKRYTTAGTTCYSVQLFAQVLRTVQYSITSVALHLGLTLGSATHNMNLKFIVLVV